MISFIIRNLKKNKVQANIKLCTPVYTINYIHLTEVTTMIRRHLPLITVRLAFTPQVLPGVPTITPRIDCSMEGLTPSGSSHTASDKGDYERDGSPSDLSSINRDEDDDTQGQEDSKIPKPDGEAG